MTGKSFRRARMLVPTLLACAMALARPAAAAPPRLALQVHLASVAERQASISQRDSVKLVRSARNEQARFERIRFGRLPWTWGGSGGVCDERIGRFCLWHGDEDSPEWQPPAEHEEVRRARQELITHLHDAWREVPGDEWVAGQLVRYLVEAERFEEARSAAAGCAGDSWWCSALAGFAAHGAGEFVAAESAYVAALGQMPDDERKEWTDLTALLAHADAKVYRRTRGAARDSLERRLWLLADPLFMIPGNDRLTEHFSRQVWDRLQDRARSTEGIPWGSDLRQLLIRYGWPTGWERIRPKAHESGRPNVVTHYASHSRSFLPPLRMLDDLSSISPDDWPLRVRMSRSEYAPSYARGFDALSHQLAVFRRGDSALVVAAFEMAADSIPDDAVVDAALIIPSLEGVSTRLDRRSALGRRGVLSVTTPPGPKVVSLEALATRERLAARARYGVTLDAEPPAGIALSDLLLVGFRDEPPRSLEEAMRHARTSLEARSGERLGVYWEVYARGDRRDPVVFEMALYRGDRGWLRRVAESVGLANDGNAVALRWQDRWDDGPVLARALNVQLPELASGVYTLELRVELAEQSATSISREIRITGAGSGAR